MTRTDGWIPGTRALGIGLAAATALVSGVAVFVNGDAVRRFPDPSVYTTAKNLVAAVLLLLVLAATSAARSPEGLTPPRRSGERLGLALVGVLGGGVAFLLFFEGLARAGSTDAGFLHKTLVVWVAALAVPLLRERLGPLHGAAIVLLVLGQALLGDGWPSVGIGTGEALVLGATLCWAVEVVVARRLLASLSPLTVGVTRMAVGSAVLLAWLATTGRAADLLGLAGWQWAWALLTGAILTAYVATWYSALARAQAVDVTAVLVLGALVTAVLDAGVRGGALAPQAPGLLLLAAGAAVFLLPRRGRWVERPA
ncbi:MAG: DMT family transporter [Acidimicrobiia bacterium]|nr:DMT family transporter [Acidimicrobiia bacterium]